MKITYDPEVDAAYIYLTDKRGGEVTTAKVNEQIFLDYGAADELVGIEILYASELLLVSTAHGRKSRSTKHWPF